MWPVDLAYLERCYTPLKGNKMINTQQLKDDVKIISKIAIPVMLAMMLQNMLSTVNLYFLGKLGTLNLSAGILGAQVANVIFILSTLTTAGIVAVVAQNFGAKRHKDNEKHIADALMLSAVFGLLIGIVFIIFGRQLILIMFNPQSETATITETYVKIMLVATPFVFCAAALRSALQGLGRTKETLYVFGSANILNMLLVSLFVFPMGWGIAGAAWATVLSNVFAFVAIYWQVAKIVYRNQWLQLIHFSKESFREYFVLLKIGSYACVQQVARPITGMLMFRIVYEVAGDAGTAAFGIGGQLLAYTFIILAGLTTGIAVLAGQSIGAGTTNRLKAIVSTGLLISTLNMLLFAIPYILLGRWVMSFFTEDAEIIRIGITYLQIVYVGLFTVIWTTVYSGVFQGAGDTFPPMLASTIAKVVIKVPLAYALVRFAQMGVEAVWWAVSFSVVIEAGLIALYYKRGRWLRKGLL